MAFLPNYFASICENLLGSYYKGKAKLLYRVNWCKDDVQKMVITFRTFAFPLFNVFFISFIMMFHNYKDRNGKTWLVLNKTIYYVKEC